MDLAIRNSTGNSLSFYKSQMDGEYLNASKSGDVNKVLECLANGVNPHVTNPGGLNILHFAARENHIEICKIAVNHGVDIKATTKRLNTALHIASLGGHSEIVKLLIAHGADINLQAKDDITPLYMASQENHIDIVEVLLKNGANAHLAAKGGFEPLHIAIQQGHTAVVNMLLERGSKQKLTPMHQAAKNDSIEALTYFLEKDPKNNTVNDRLPNGYTPLHVACKFGSIKAAKFLIENGADLNAEAKHVVPLHVASRHGQAESIKILVEAGANLSVTTKDGLTALHCAARDGRDRCVELLLVYGAPITAKTTHGLTALHMAAQGDHVSSVNHLLAHGAHINETTTDGVTTLHVAAHYGQVKTTQSLLEQGANVDQKAHNGYTALHIASKKNREAVVQILLKHSVAVQIKNNNGQTALHVAAFFGHVNIVLLLLQAGASTEELTTREETVLHVSCRTVRIQIVRLLIRNNAEVNAKTKEGETPLHVACRQGGSTLVSLLLDNYADPNAQNKEGSSALHLAARDGNEDIVESLLDHNTDVTLKSNRGFTPLHEAAKNGHASIVEVLLGKRETDVNASGKNGLTPLHIACHYDQSEIAIQLLNAGANIQAQAKNGFTPLHVAAKKNQHYICTLLFGRGCEADMTTRHGVSPLHLAAKEGNVEIVDTLLEHGALPSLQTTNGLSPLHVAVHYNQIEVVRRLLKYTTGIINTTTQTGFTSLHLAASYGHYEMAKLLLENEANVEAKTKTGNTPLHLATVNGHDKIIDLLLKYNAPPNALNKEGHSALYLAEITQQTIIINILQKITKVVIKKEETTVPAAKRWEKIRHIFLNPEALETTLLIDATDEAEDQVHKEKKTIQEDFEECFAGLDETSHSPSPAVHRAVKETGISASEENQVENMAQDHDEFLNSLDDALGMDEIPEKKKVRVLTKKTIVETKDYQKFITENPFISGPPKQGSFLVSFNVDARGATMESKQSGVKIALPPGACDMPTRITVRFRKNTVLPAHLSLLPQECIASRVLHMSPERMQFLKPVTMEIPHLVSLRNKERELLVMKYDGKRSKWIELSLDKNSMRNSGYVSVALQEVPEKLILVSRPLKERFVMNPAGGEIHSASIPEVAIAFPPKTLNTPTKLVLQSQPINRKLLAGTEDDRQIPGLGPIVSLDPPTKLSKPINVSMPLPQGGGGEEGKLHLLAWLPQDAKSSSHSIRSDCVWKDITENTPLSIVRDVATFSTTEFTRYWLIQTRDVGQALTQIKDLEGYASVVSYDAQIIILARVNHHVKEDEVSIKNKRSGELRICLVTEEYSSRKKTLFDPSEGFVEVCRSEKLATYQGQTLVIRLAEDVSTTTLSRNLHLTFHPFQVNSIQFKVDFVRPPSEERVRGVVSFITDYAKGDGGSDNGTHFCFLDIEIGEEHCKTSRIHYHEDIANNDIINTVGRQIGDGWFQFADELGLNNRDKQAIIDISSGKYDVPAVRLLEYWRVKNPTTSTYKALYDALKRSGNNEQAENVYNASPNELSREVSARPQPLSRHYTPLATFEIQEKPTTVECITKTWSPTMESDSHFSVSPVPSDIADQLSYSPNNWDESTSPDISSEITMSTTYAHNQKEEGDLMDRTISSPEQDDDSDVMVEKQSEYEGSPLSSFEYGSGNPERWSTTATYAANTPEDEKVPDGEVRLRSPVSPVSIRSDRLTKDGEGEEAESRPISFRRESSFESNIVTPCDVSATVTPHTCSPALENEDDVVQTKVLDERPPDIDFSALEGDNEEINDVPQSEERAVGPYELSIQQRQRELEEAWELEHTRDNLALDYASNQPVAEESIMEQKQEQIESGIDFENLLDSSKDNDDFETEVQADDTPVVAQYGLLPNEPAFDAQSEENSAQEPDFCHGENPEISDISQEENTEKVEAVDHQEGNFDVADEDNNIEMIEAADPTQSNSAGQHISRSYDADDNKDEDSNLHIIEHHITTEEQQNIKSDSQPEIDFSVLGEPDDSEAPPSPSLLDEQVMSHYELSIQQSQRELDEEWEKEHAVVSPINSDHGSRTLVEEEDLFEKKRKNPDIELDDQQKELDTVTSEEIQQEVEREVYPLNYSDVFIDLEEKEEIPPLNHIDFTIVPETVPEDEATPYYELSTSEKVKIGDKLVEAPVYMPATQSEPPLIDCDDDSIDSNHPYNENEVLPATEEGRQYSVVIPVTEAAMPVNSVATQPIFSLGSPCEEFITDRGYETKTEEHHQEDDIVENENGFTKVMSNTVVSEKVLSSKTEVREVTPEELQQLIALQQQQHNGEDGAMTTIISTTTVVNREITIEPDDCNGNVPSGESHSDLAIDPPVSSTQDGEVLEIELNSDEENISEQDLVQKLFGDQQSVLEFFHDGEEIEEEEQLAIKNNRGEECNGVGKVDEYGTQV